ncbi:DUF6907 domain-containing protein [Streptomyces chartreusis]
MSNTVQTPVAFLDGIPSPKSPAGSPDSRLVPALIGTFHSNQVVHIECPRWCTADHMDEPSEPGHVTHYAETSGVEVASFLDDTTLAYALRASLEADPTSTDARMRAAHIMVWEDAGAVEARLTAGMAEELADDLVGFAVRLRQLARTARLANHDAPAERAA